VRWPSLETLWPDTASQSRPYAAVGSDNRRPLISTNAKGLVSCKNLNNNLRSFKKMDLH